MPSGPADAREAPVSCTATAAEGGRTLPTGSWYWKRRKGRRRRKKRKGLSRGGRRAGPFDSAKSVPKFCPHKINHRTPTQSFKRSFFIQSLQSFALKLLHNIFNRTPTLEMANITLMTYLQQALPPLPAMPPPAGHNTQNTAYSWNDIVNLTVWRGFDLNAVLRYQALLNTTFLPPDPMPLSPRKPVNAENAVKNRAGELVHPRIRRSLRAGFATLTGNNRMRNLTEVSFDIGEAARLVDNFIPDLAFFVENQFGIGANRVPGDIKP